MNEYKVDYHIHTTYSDGLMTPTNIIKQAKQIGIETIAITDHDNIDGLEEARIAGEATDLKVVPGIEIASESKEGIGQHILGYNFDVNNKALHEFLAQLIRNRDERNERLLAELNDMGYRLKMEDLDIGDNDFLGKPIIARAMVRKNYIKNDREAFGDKILGSARCRAIKKVKPTIAEAIDIIKTAGGTPVLAHPIQTRGAGEPGSEEFFANMEKGIGIMKGYGLEGLECYHPDQNEEQSLRFVEIAEKYHLHITRGSDFHGADYIEANRTGVYR